MADEEDSENKGLLNTQTDPEKKSSSDTQEEQQVTSKISIVASDGGLGRTSSTPLLDEGDTTTTATTQEEDNNDLDPALLTFNLEVTAPPTDSTTHVQPAKGRVPEASPEALKYIQTAVAEMDPIPLMFKDRLVTVSDTGKELGDYTVSMETMRFHGERCLLIHANSNGKVDGVPCGTSIVCYVCPLTLETLEQHHHEFVKLEHRPLDRKTVILRQKDNYVVTEVVARGKEVKSTSTTYSLASMRGFISEGSNMLLHRIFILHGMPENELQFICFDSEDNLCPTVYRQLDKRKQKVEEVNLMVKGVERTIDSKVDLPTTWQSYFTSEGFLTNKTQVGCPVTMTLYTMPIKKEEQKPAKPAFEKKELVWDDDLQMYSKFVDRKEELKNSHQTFLSHHPELRTLLADFLQFLLLTKPSDVVQFSADYFAAFSKMLPPTPRYHASAVRPPFPHCATTPEIEALKAWKLNK